MRHSQQNFSMLIAVFLGLLFFSGCVSNGKYVNDVNRSMSDIHTAVSRIWGIQSKSHDERIIFTPPLRTNPTDTTPESRLKERLVARVVIVGDRRPYDVLVQVYLETKVRGKWEEVGLDEGYSEVFASELNRELIESRENRNVIDDFRAF